ncbi:G-type lectin S-receptor-like serine/threonine-protein kinase At4g27290 isoform X1 [Malus sylvestris]|uniref:G-type lectin S-receptor-like serine/threonine-protein kinase At4g27290 isoform X1 n=1 Tax=Malus sylvestris TaxID=3752 RepID=UPI0021ABE5C5|nr:G-type lectin S-receptor-like serine/threonine-protein kinase At4g27290 isoform X1 [Malus sylvestris]XP_050144791.1 G-type lectin S-receptor-like serine/threonine-protein kinase At4g27290 isoform X1 [Malus sylvestris]XP_050144792.1 G-type lectin S-receptor-like serine/threonine-protein kinase At4g27290 isoform X1 [Malus sylvestris]XP_050144793.1 G-type lectin S-receptor-like serine/threonine-protein kinase At4g27290 isoform X1 [Malus sylvestris]
MYSFRNMTMQSLRSIFVCLFLLSFLRISSAATLGTITRSQYIRDGETLVSAGGGFELGFFSPGNSKGRYLGIWYTVSADTVVWVANRETPLGDSSGFLKLSEQGVLVLLNSSDNIVWSSNSSRTVGNPVSQLLDTGNLIVKDGNETNSDNFSWQSFDYPCDTFLPEMKLGWDLASGLERYVSSWKSTENPAPGDFSLRISRWGLPQLVTMKGAKIQARGGSWNGVHFTGYGSSGIRNSNPLPGVEFRLNKNEVYYEYRLLNRSEFSRYVLNPLGITQRFTWVYQTQSWELSFTFQADQCENYALCGAYATCNINNAPICACLKGFAPKSPKDWNSGYWSGGCVRKTPLACSHGDGFLKYNGIKLPDTSTSWFNKSMSLKECKWLCLENCSCTAYANLDIRVGGSGCLLWFGNLIDIREFAISDVQDLYIRMAASELDHFVKESKFNKKKLPILISFAVLLLGTIIVGLILYIRKKKLRNEGVRRNDFRKEYLGEDRELPLFDLTTIAKATDNFSSSNKLGEGGFGPVYKGTLMGGKEVAVKRLSKDSGQGMREFKNEVKMIARLQHRNLVKLLGCCTQEDEKILIYEFMPNRSLDFFVFVSSDEEGRKLLNWPKCFHIIGGIARGLVYLHHDSRLRVIHRDLKASNILLDNNLNPKIADFGLAKIFDSDQSQASTNRVVGTYGYMSPEYAVDGIFSMKSDVFSFGVIVLEMLCRKKNRGFCHPDHHLNLLGHAWMLWMQDKQLELIDKTLSDSCNIYEVVRCLHVGLLCVQRVPEDRPSMSSVVLMLSSDVALPSPKQPGFYTERSVSESPSSKRPCSENDVSITLIEPR